MKKVSLLAIAGMMAIGGFYGCQKDVSDNLQLELQGKGKPAQQPASESCSNYDMQLTRTYENGLTTFTWRITNPNPGNGTNGTIQDLSHWSFVPGCAGENGLLENWEDLISASYSYNGSDWIMLDPTPSMKTDPSQNCYTGDVFKFDQGTSGRNATYYQVVLAGNYGTENMTAVFKSGARTGCCVKTVQGIGCKTTDICSLSQGYYFAKPGPTWPAPGTVMIGGHSYTEAEGRAIWNCSNAGGISDAKKAFLQVAAIKLSGIYPTGIASIDGDVALIDSWLSGLNKLVACDLDYSNAAAAQAAGRIGDWIDDNHCED